MYFWLSPTFFIWEWSMCQHVLNGPSEHLPFLEESHGLLGLYMDFINRLRSLLCLCLSWTHIDLLCLMYVLPYWLSSAPFLFSSWTLERTICLWCSGRTAENHTEHIFDECLCWFMLWICRVYLLKWDYLFWWKMQKVSWINNERNFWCLSSWPN